MLEKPLIVFAAAYPTLYGAQRSLYGLYRRFHEQGRYRVHFLYNVEGELSAAIGALGIPMTRIAPRGLLATFEQRLLRLRPWDYPRLAVSMLAHSARVRRVLRELAPAMLHCNGDRAFLLNFLGAKVAGCPAVTHVRRQPSFGRLDKVIFSQATHVVWVSEGVRAYYTDLWNLRPDLGTVVHNGRVTPAARSEERRAELLAEFRLPADAFVVLKLAALAERKDHEMMIRAATIACAKDPRMYFLAGGKDTSEDASRLTTLQALVDAAGLAEQVRFLGHRSDADRLLCGADVLINAARHEPLGGSMIEAVGTGVPVVATNVGGTAEIVPDGRCGFLVPPGAADEMAERLLRLRADEDLRRRLGENGRAHFAEHFEINTCVKRTAELFDKIIAEHAHPKHSDETR